MKTYWAIAPVNEHPSKAREIDSLQSALGERVCQGFTSTFELVKSIRFGDIMTERDDPAPRFEVVRVVGDDSTEQREGHGVEGIFVEVVEIEERIPILEWAEALKSSSNAEEAEEAGFRLIMYQDMRDMVAEEG